ncbi:acyltransferase family [Plasmopara halstedii]|uniref:Acyltransferase family n=1 Tax=Plasmopara halstedii TaxID=4781 RepID=A0A0P1AU91_PLAHL|nr:acyltransferase family [Plasmopara halstedii]CEG45244.1 acyltransferase family [Plasmopara halstedii]|eukprot:XP_024581613.1 acyltransferase family [Plasmopara halstedii]
MVHQIVHTESNDSLDHKELSVDVENSSDTQQLVESESKDPLPSTIPTASTKILFLDGVRGLAAILVVCQHSGEYLHDLDLGACAVDTFFVLSSFLLTLLFLKKSIRLFAQQASFRTWSLSLLDYFQKRFFRVYPLFATVALFIWILPSEEKKRYYLVNDRDHFDLFKVLTFSFSHRYFVFWTLPLEISYYFCLPVLGIAFLQLGRLWWVPFLPLYGWIIYAGWHQRRSSHSPLMPHFPTFLAGSLAAALFLKFDRWMRTVGFKFSKVHIIAIRAVEYAMIAIILSVCFRRNSNPDQPTQPTMIFHWVQQEEKNLKGFPFISLPLTIFIVIEMLLPSCFSGIFEWNVLRYWGKISFSVYLLHSFIVRSDIYGKDPSLYYDRLFARFGLILILCTASYHLVEYPSQLLAQHITRMLNAQESKGLGSSPHRLSFDAKHGRFRAPNTIQSA